MLSKDLSLRISQIWLTIPLMALSKSDFIRGQRSLQNNL
jgi:hypothetical protein